MADDDLDDWNPFEVIEEDREKLEALGTLRRETKEFPRHLLITDPLWAREVVRKAKAEKQVEKEAKARQEIPPPEQPARPALEQEWPGAAKTLRKRLAGWRVEGWYMRGPVISSANRDVPIRSAFVLAASHAGRRIRVVFDQHEETGKWTRKAGYAWTPGETFSWTSLGAKELVAYCEPDEQPTLEAQVIE